MPGKVLVVEDPLVRRFIGGILSRAGFAVFEAGALRAIEILNGEEAIALLITNTPEVFVNWSRELPLLYVAACPDELKAAQFRWCRMLAKPFHPNELIQVVWELTAAALKRHWTAMECNATLG